MVLCLDYVFQLLRLISRIAVKLTTRCLQFKKRHNLLVKNISTVVAKVVIDIEEDYVQRLSIQMRRDWSLHSAGMHAILQIRD